MGKNNPTDKGDDATLFREAMRGVKPLGKGSKAPDDVARPVIRKPASVLSGHLLKKHYEDKPNAKAVAGEAFIDYYHSSLPHRERRRLKRGQIPTEADLDLHGMTLAQAREAFVQFLTNAQARQYRCVKIIHGKGALDAVPVLKNAVYQWLPQSDAVLAFCSAQRRDGGAGALYVLMRAMPQGI